MGIRNGVTSTGDSSTILFLNISNFFLLILIKITGKPAPILNYLKACFYPPTKSAGYSFGVVSAFVRPHFLSVWNHISVPIGQI